METNFSLPSLSGESFEDFMRSIEVSMTNLVKETSKIPQDFQENLEAFTAAINWKDGIIRFLLVLHVLILLLTILTRKNLTIQSIIFFSISMVLFFTERINSWCHLHWREIASQDYFDQHGVFAGIFFAGPLLFISFLQLINFLKMAADDLVKVKRMQLADQKKKEKEKKSD